MKKRNSERFKAAYTNLKRLHDATQTNQLSLFYLNKSDFPTIPNLESPPGTPHCADTSSGQQSVNVSGALEFATSRLWFDVYYQSIKRAQVTKDRRHRVRQRHYASPHQSPDWTDG